MQGARRCPEEGRCVTAACSPPAWDRACSNTQHCSPPDPPRLNKVVALVGAVLRDLRLAIAGTIALSDELLEALDSLFNARVPRRWAKIRWAGWCGVE